MVTSAGVGVDYKRDWSSTSRGSYSLDLTGLKTGTNSISHDIIIAAT
jgi:hypothetical protein